MRAVAVWQQAGATSCRAAHQCPFTPPPPPNTHAPAPPAAPLLVLLLLAAAAQTSGAVRTALRPPLASPPGPAPALGQAQGAARVQAAAPPAGRAGGAHALGRPGLAPAPPHAQADEGDHDDHKHGDARPRAEHHLLKPVAAAACGPGGGAGPGLVCGCARVTLQSARSGPRAHRPPKPAPSQAMRPTTRLPPQQHHQAGPSRA